MRGGFPNRSTVLVAIFIALLLFSGCCLARYARHALPGAARPVSEPWLQVGPAGALVDDDGLRVPPRQRLTVSLPAGMNNRGFSVRLHTLVLSGQRFRVGFRSDGGEHALEMSPESLRLPFRPGTTIDIEVAGGGQQVRTVVDGGVFSIVPLGSGHVREVWLTGDEADLRVAELELRAFGQGVVARRSFGHSAAGMAAVRFAAALGALLALLGLELLLARRLGADRRRWLFGWIVTTAAMSALLAAFSINSWLTELGPLVCVLWVTLRVRHWALAADLFAQRRVPWWRTFLALAGLAAMGAVYAHVALAFASDPRASEAINGAIPVALVVLCLLAFARETQLGVIRAAAALGPALALYLLAFALLTPAKWETDRALFLLLPPAALLISLPFAAQKRRLRLYGVYMFVLTALLVFSLEAALRSSPIASYLRPLGVGKTYDVDGDLFWAPKSFLAWDPSFAGRDDTRVKAINFRGKTKTPRDKPAGMLRLLTVGGSNTFGDGIDREEQTFSGVLEQRLNARGVAAEVLNAGVCGYNSTQCMVLLKKHALSYRPDIVILYLMRNDIYAGQARYTFRELWRKANSPAARLRRQLQHSYLYNAFAAVIVAARERTRQQWWDPGLWRDANPPADFAANLREMIRDSRRAGAKVVVVSEFFGDRLMKQVRNVRIADFRAVMEQVARAERVPYYDAYDHFAASDDPWAWLFPHDLTHLNPEGHAELARYLEDILRQLQYVP